MHHLLMMHFSRERGPSEMQRYWNALTPASPHLEAASPLLLSKQRAPAKPSDSADVDRELPPAPSARQASSHPSLGRQITAARSTSAFRRHSDHTHAGGSGGEPKLLAPLALVNAVIEAPRVWLGSVAPAREGARYLQLKLRTPTRPPNWVRGEWEDEMTFSELCIIF